MKKQHTATKKILSDSDQKFEKAFGGLLMLEVEDDADSETDNARTQKYQPLNYHCPDSNLRPRFNKLF